MDLTRLIEPRCDLPRLSQTLDELGHFGRVWAVHGWTRKHMTSLWYASQGFRAIGLEHFVPPEVDPLVEVIHEGKNSMAAATIFEKRFCRPGQAEGLVGYNEQSLSAFSGPGYYVARPGEPGEVELDYTVRPRAAPPAWPPVVPNTSRFGRWVYAGLIDVMRGLSSHVAVGRVRKDRRWLDKWFVLVRCDPGASAGSA
jgi:hypothetical protein